MMILGEERARRRSDAAAADAGRTEAAAPSGDGQDPGGNNGDGIGDQHDPERHRRRHAPQQQSHTKRAWQGKEAEGDRAPDHPRLGAKGLRLDELQARLRRLHRRVEEVMSKEKVPPGYRFYIKRYFQLIKPRE